MLSNFEHGQTTLFFKKGTKLEELKKQKSKVGKSAN
jgi:hypothetical protein